MKFCVGLSLQPGQEPFSEMIRDYLPAVNEVYFSWSNAASGRPCPPETDWGAQERLLPELQELRRLGLRLDLLFNANCYGDHALSRRFGDEILGLLDYLNDHDTLPQVVTTTSLFVAHTIRHAAPEIELRASVNMRLDSTLALEILGEKFDSFYLRRDLQRDLDTVARFRQWCDQHGKKMGILANSGCLRNCPAQTFHDNTVAHQREICERQVMFQPAICREYFSHAGHGETFLKGSWIRPEDLHRYQGLVDFVKLATRQHDRPRMVVGAYTAGQWSGNLAALCEPNYSQMLNVDNGAFPPDWFGTAAKCATDCRHCGRCRQIWQTVSRPLC